MPQAFATFGWLAVLVIAGSAAATWLSGSLYGRLCNAVPDARSLADVGRASHHRTGRNMAAGFVILTQILMCLVLQLAAATSLQHTLKGIPQNQPDGMLPLWLAQLIVGVAVAVASQLRQLAQLSWLCYAGNVAQLIAAGLLAAGMLSDINCQSDSRSAHGCGAAAPAGKDPGSQHAWPYDVVTLLGVVFAYGGQYAYVDVAHQMRCRTAFAAMQHASNGIMTVLYLLFGAMVYAARGPAAAELQVFAANGPAAFMAHCCGMCAGADSGSACDLCVHMDHHSCHVVPVLPRRLQSHAHAHSIYHISAPRYTQNDCCIICWIQRWFHVPVG